MENLKKFISLPLKHKIVSIVILIVIAVATVFGTTACSLKAKDLEFKADPTQNYNTQGVNENE